MLQDRGEIRSLKLPVRRVLRQPRVGPVKPEITWAYFRSMHLFRRFSVSPPCIGFIVLATFLIVVVYPLTSMKMTSPPALHPRGEQRKGVDVPVPFPSFYRPAVGALYCLSLMLRLSFTTPFCQLPSSSVILVKWKCLCPNLASSIRVLSLKNGSIDQSPDWFCREIPQLLNTEV